MRTLVAHAAEALAPFGYRLRAKRLWRINGGIYTLIDFQSGAYGKYFFVNVCIHPLGLPQLLARDLVILDRPVEHECILRRRIEDIAKTSATEPFHKALVSPDDVHVGEFIHCLSTDVHSWLLHWGQFSVLAHAADCDLHPMLTVAPVLWPKAAAMLKFFCYLQLGESDEARRHLDRCRDAPTGEYDFSHVDEYLESLLM